MPRSSIQHSLVDLRGFELRSTSPDCRRSSHNTFPSFPRKTHNLLINFKLRTINRIRVSLTGPRDAYKNGSDLLIEHKFFELFPGRVSQPRWLSRCHRMKLWSNFVAREPKWSFIVLQVRRVKTYSRQANWT